MADGRYFNFQNGPNEQVLDAVLLIVMANPVRAVFRLMVADRKKSGQLLQPFYKGQILHGMSQFTTFISLSQKWPSSFVADWFYCFCLADLSL